MISLLTSSVPNFKFYSCVIYSHCLWEEGSTYCGFLDDHLIVKIRSKTKKGHLRLHYFAYDYKYNYIAIYAWIQLCTKLLAFTWNSTNCPLTKRKTRLDFPAPTSPRRTWKIFQKSISTNHQNRRPICSMLNKHDQKTKRVETHFHILEKRITFHFSAPPIHIKICGLAYSW